MGILEAALGVSLQPSVPSLPPPLLFHLEPLSLIVLRVVQANLGFQALFIFVPLLGTEAAGHRA